MVEKLGHEEQVITLDLGRNQALDSIFRFKKRLNNSGDDFSFLQGLAHGLVTVFKNRSRAAYELHYVAVTKSTLLAERGIAVPAGIKYVPAGMAPFIEGDIVLVETIVSMCMSANAVP